MRGAPKTRVLHSGGEQVISMDARASPAGCACCIGSIRIAARPICNGIAFGRAQTVFSVTSVRIRAHPRTRGQRSVCPHLAERAEVLENSRLVLPVPSAMHVHIFSLFLRRKRPRTGLSPHGVRHGSNVAGNRRTSLACKGYSANCVLHFVSC